MRNKFIHKSAVIEPGAKVASDVVIGPFSYIGSEVILHSGVEIKSHVVVT
jgi:UDP-N-acetylglucosamine acyltransferase